MLALFNHWTADDFYSVVFTSVVVAVIATLLVVVPKLLVNSRLRNEPGSPQVPISWRPVALAFLAAMVLFGFLGNWSVQTEHNTSTVAAKMLEESPYFKSAEVREIDLYYIKFSTEDCSVTMYISPGGRARVSNLFQHDQNDIVISQEELHFADEAIAFAEQWCSSDLSTELS